VFEDVNFQSLLHVSVAFVFLCYASWRDIKTREVSNKVWFQFAVSAALLSLLDFYIFRDFDLNGVTVSLAVTSVLSVSLFYLGFFGGADAKALICLSIILPTPQRFLYSRSTLTLPIFAISVFDNAILIATSTIVYIFAENIRGWPRTSGKLLKGLESESAYKKLLVLLSCRKIRISDLEKKPFYHLAESFGDSLDGKLTRKLRVFVKAGSEGELSPALIKKLVEQEKILGEVWASPGLPMIAFFTISLAITLLFGDVVLIASLIVRAAFTSFPLL
jgi:preflagellin peptidase FlaK